jgi:hypothetical protein
MSTKYFSEAYADYKYLREKSYPEKAALKLVCDRHRLSRVERNAIFRGAVTAAIAGARKQKIVPPEKAAGGSLGIDWYNVLITVESYLKGMPLFISDDGVLRDCAATHGGYRRSALTERAMREILAALAALSPARIDAYLDAPIAHSGLMAEELRLRLREIPCRSEATLARSADFLLKGHAGIICSSDSVVMDSAANIIDLARWVLFSAFGVTPPRLLDAFPGALFLPPGASPSATAGPPQLSGSGNPGR